MRNERVLTWLLGLALLCGCTLSNQGVGAVPPADPSGLMIPTEPATTIPSEPETVDGWLMIAPGLEWRILPYAQGTSIELAVLRVDPTHFTFRAHYQPGEVYRLRDWQDRLDGAVAIINANFFDENDNALGLVVTDSVRHGFSYTDRGATFVVQSGLPDIRSSVNEPLGAEAIEQAVQAFPMLVMNGQQTFFDAGRSARRTAIAQDTAGRVLLIATVRGGVPLHEFSAFLAHSDLELVDAVNLDGGGSTFIGVEWPGFEYAFQSFDPVPVVLAVYPR